MRKLWFRRKAVSTVIGGVIVLTIFLTALVAMVVVSQQNDAYQATVKQMAQKDIDRKAENLQVIYPGISTVSTGISCAGASGCDEFTMTINNLAGIGTQIARIYINSTTECSSLCILDSDPVLGPTASTFNTAGQFINPSEPNHLLTFWLEANELTDGVSHQVSVVTTRGRVFSFTWPFPVSGQSVPTGTLYLGCLAIDFDDLLVTYTSYSSISTQPPAIPATPVKGGWLFPGKIPLLFYVRVRNICAATVMLLDKSTFYAIQYTGAGGGAAPAFYLAQSMDQTYCVKYFPTTYCMLDSANNPNYSPPVAGNTYPTSGGNIVAYNASQLQGPDPYKGETQCLRDRPCYNIPAAPGAGQPNVYTYLTFGAVNPCFSGNVCSGGTTSANGFQGDYGGTYVVFLAIYWRCMTDGDSSCLKGYEFGVTLPFITIQTCNPSGGKFACPT